MRTHPDYHRAVREAAGWSAAGLVSIAAFVFVPPLHFVLPTGVNVALHALLETVSIVVAALVFSCGAMRLTGRQGGSIAVVGTGMLVTSVLDFLHVLSFEGMPDFVTPSGGGKAISFFLGARLIAAMAMLGIAYLPWRRSASRWGSAFTGASVVVGLVVAVGGFAPGVKEFFFVPGQGLTPPKLAAEWLLVALCLTAAGGLLRRMRRPQPFPVGHFLIASLLMAVSEVCFTLYARPQDQYNNLGHLWKVVAYLFVYRGVLLYVVHRPYLQLRRARAELHATAHSFRQLFVHSMDAVVVVERHGGVLAVNPAACRMLGAHAKQLRQVSLRSLVETSTPPLHDLEEALDHSGAAAATMELRRWTGELFHAEVHLASYRDGQGRDVVSCVVRDVTDRHRAQLRILQLNATLEERVRERTARLEAANQDLQAFSYSVAHDLRAPLSAINGFSAALEERWRDRLEPRERHYLARIRANSQNMGEMIDALLELSRLSRAPLEARSLELAPLAEAVVENLRRAEPRRDVQLEVQQPLPAYGDATLLRTALQNLIGNAWKFTARRTPARIEVGAAHQPDGQLAYFVRDNGEGFDMALADRLFGAFQRLHNDPAFSGHGIGLVNVQRIVALHGGRVWAQSQPQCGATFWFTLGLPAPMPAASASQGNVIPAQAGIQSVEEESLGSPPARG